MALVSVDAQRQKRTASWLDRDLVAAVPQRLAQEAREAGTSGALSGIEDLPPFEHIARAFADRVRYLGGAPPLEWPSENPVLDYVSLVDAEHQQRHGRKRRRRDR